MYNIGKLEYRQFIQRVLHCFNMYAAAQNTVTPINDYNLTSIEWQVLTSLYYNKINALNMITLAHSLGIAKSTFSKSVAKLTKLDLVEKKHKEGNKKEIFVCLNIQGENLFHEAIRRNEFFIQHLFKTLDEDESKIYYFYEFLKLMEDFLHHKIDSTELREE